MPAIDELLADLATHPPAPPTPVAEIRGRARRRATRRRAFAGAAAVLVVAAAGFGVGVAVTAEDPGDEVHADGGPDASDAPSSSSTTASTTVPPSTTEVPVAMAEPAMALEPASGYEDGTIVRMALDEPATGPAVVLQCAAEAERFDGSPDGVSWCSGLVEARAEALEPFRLSRFVTTPDGDVDCAEAVGRCTLGVRVGDVAVADLRTAPLAFRPVPTSADPAAVVDGDEGTVGDGDTLLVTLTGVETGDTYRVVQCRTGVPSAQSDDGEGSQCSGARGRTVGVQDGPETQLVFTAFHDVYTMVETGTPGLWEPGWAGCEPCELRIYAEGRSDPITVLPLVMEPTDVPIRPAITVEPAGPHAPGAEVTVVATGLQRDGEALVAWCLVEQPQGGGASPCSLVTEEGSTTVPVDGRGTARIEGFVLPSARGHQGQDCIAVPGTCGVGIHDLAWSTYLAIAPVDLSG